MDWTVCDVALRAPVTVRPETTLAEAEQLLIRSNATDLYVVDAQERLLGVVPDYELLKRRLLGGDSLTAVECLMSPVTVSLAPGASLECGARLLREHIHASVPIVDRGRLIGQLCRANLLRILAEIAAVDACGPTVEEPVEAESSNPELLAEQIEQVPPAEVPGRPATPHFLKAFFSAPRLDDSRIS